MHGWIILWLVVSGTVLGKLVNTFADSSILMLELIYSRVFMCVYQEELKKRKKDNCSKPKKSCSINEGGDREEGQSISRNGTEGKEEQLKN